MRKIFLFLFCLLFCVSIFSQETQKVDEFGDLYCDDSKARLDAVAYFLRETPESKIYIIYYTGKLYKQSVYDKKIKTYKEVFLPPRINEAEMIIQRWMNYLTFVRGISKNKIVLVNGGFREEHTLEFWIVPKSAMPPKPTPTLTQKDIKFRKGKAKYVECTV